MSIELVVARYKEPLGWLRNTRPGLRRTVYDKSGTPTDGPVPAQVFALDNVGHEAHTYLHHILTRWDSLEDVTVFVQGHPFDHACDLHTFLRGLCDGSKAVNGFHWLGFIIDTDDPRGRRLFVPWSKNVDGRELATDTFHQRLFDAPCPDALPFYLGGQFAVTRDLIHSRPRALYERALMLAVTFADAPHCFERLWDRVFGVIGVDPALMDGASTRYLRSVRRPVAGAISPATADARPEQGHRGSIDNL